MDLNDPNLHKKKDNGLVIVVEMVPPRKWYTDELPQCAGSGSNVCREDTSLVFRNLDGEKQYACVVHSHVIAKSMLRKR
jgi:hypothetical protein